MLQTVKAERGAISTAPVCTKGDNKNCYSSVRRVKGLITKDFMQKRELKKEATRAARISSRGTAVGSAYGSEDLKADGVIDTLTSSSMPRKGFVKPSKLTI